MQNQLNYYKQRESEAPTEQEKRYWHRKANYEKLVARRAYGVELNEKAVNRMEHLQ